MLTAFAAVLLAGPVIMGAILVISLRDPSGGTPKATTVHKVRKEEA